jgi:hypothetical protein
MGLVAAALYTKSDKEQTAYPPGVHARVFLDGSSVVQTGLGRAQVDPLGSDGMCSMTRQYPQSPLDPSSFRSVVGIDIGSQRCSFCTLKPDKSVIIKPTQVANAAAGFAILKEKLEHFGVAPNQILMYV